MRLRFILIFITVASLIGYLLGNWMPYELFHPVINNREISINDFYTRLISIVGACATIFATLVALFKEDIRKLYEYAALDVSFKDPENILIEEIDSEVTQASSSNGHILKAKKYEIVLSIKNKGRLAAKGCQIYLEKLSFKSNSSPTSKEILTSGKPLSWIGKSDLTTIIPTTAKVFTTIIEILSPDAESVASDGSSKGQVKPQIKIAGTDFPVSSQNGIFTFDYNIYSENATPINYKLKIEWNGKWEKRLAEMKQNITITKI